MRKSSLFLVVLGVVLAGCGEGAPESVTSTFPATSTSTTVAAPTTTHESTTASTTTVTTSTTAAPTTIVTPTTAAASTAWDLEQRLTDEFSESTAGEIWRIPDAWSCALVAGPSGAGSVYKCMPTEVGEGQWPIITALILDDAGTVAFAQAGVFYTVLNADLIQEDLGTGLFCRDLYAVDSWLLEELPTPELEYFGAVLYWFVEGRPDRMDADGNGIPCETLVPASVVDAVWAGGWIEG